MRAILLPRNNPQARLQSSFWRSNT